MLPRLPFAALWVLVLSAAAAEAQSLAQLGGPANLPPPGFSGQQFVDNRGCLFLRAGFGTNVNWVPRIDRNRKPLCGYPPTFGAAVTATVEPVIAPEPEISALAEPATAPSVALAQPVAVASAAQPDAAPPARKRRTLMELLFGTPKPASAPSPAPVMAQSTPPAPPAPATAPSSAIPRPPAGYQLAWKDDRLNPLRGMGTAAGQAQQDQVWTRNIPAVLVTTTPQAARARVTVSTMSAPQGQSAKAPDVQRAASYVQIASFAQPANADAVKAQLRALGMPVATSQRMSKGKVLQVIYAGPFAALAEAERALALARDAGFSDAALR